MRLPSWCKINRIVDVSLRLTPGDLLVADDGRVLLYVRRVHGLKVITVPKYVAGNGPWSIPYFTTLRRIIRTYSPREISALFSIADKEYLPYYGATAPLQDLTTFKGLVCSLTPPLYRIMAELDWFSDNEWSLLSTVLPELLMCGKPTGSLLMASLKSFSDIDIIYVIDNSLCRKALEEHVQYNRVRPLPHTQLAEWCYREASSRGLPIEIIAKLYRPWSRFVLGKRTISLSFASASLRWSEERRIVHTSNSIVETTVHVDSYSYSLADFPAVVETQEGIYILVYDGLFIPPLYEGGVFHVRGIKSKISTSKGDLEALVIGTREALTFVEPLRVHV